MAIPRSRRALSPVVAAIILVGVTIVVSLLVAIWMGALTFTFMKADLDVSVSASIYSVSHNIGVLNEDVIFEIFIKNHVNSTRKINMVVDADEHVLFNETVIIEVLSSKNLTIKQQLMSLGLWTIRFYEDKRTPDNQQVANNRGIVGSYSFLTVVNKVEADLKITQLDNIRLNTKLSIIAISISLISAFVGLYNIIYSRKQQAKD